MRAAPLRGAVLLLGASACGDGTAGVAHDNCEFVIHKNAVSANIATVGVVEWELVGAPPASAKIVYGIAAPSPAVLNVGGEAPVDLTKPNYRTLLLGLKQSEDYTFNIRATRGRTTCESDTYPLRTTGVYAEAPSVAREVSQPGKREAGFIVTSSGTSLPSSAFIIDADGDVVWYAAGPENTARAQMDYEGDSMWMAALNFNNAGGEMRAVSMDGERVQADVPGLQNAHHDFTVLPGGKVAALVWSEPGIDPESELVVRSLDGTVASLFSIGRSLYLSDSYHANAVHYLPSDDSFTISDRNPNLVVKVSSGGVVQWQLGGSCAGAQAGRRCVAGAWQVNHGHQLLDDGTFVLFNNGYAQNAHILEFRIKESLGALEAGLVFDYPGDAASSNLGDVQRLPGGNTLVTYSSDGKIVELDESWNEVQTFSVRAGYSSWRPTLYGPPTRL